MNQHYRTGNLLMASNYPSDTAYAWWLMENFWKILAEQFEKVGGKTYLAYPKITTLSETITNSPIIPIELSLPWRRKKEAIQTYKFIRKNNITFLYFTDQPYFSSQYAIMHLWGIRQIVVHDHTPGDRPPVGGLRGAMKATRNIIPWLTADYVLCVSELMRHRNMTNIRIPGNKCFVVQNGIQPVVCTRKNDATLKKSLNVQPNSILVISTGRAHPYKRFDFIIRCAKALNNKSPNLDVVFLLIGDGPAMSELNDMVQSLGLEGSVRLLGFRSDVRALLCISDIALHAALGEGFSLSIIEYMSAGLPVLVPDIPSVNQAIKHNDSGIIYPKDDTETVASYIIRLATDRKARLAMGNTAKISANNAYNLEKCTSDFMSFVDMLFSAHNKIIL